MHYFLREIWTMNAVGADKRVSVYIDMYVKVNDYLSMVIIITETICVHFFM